MGFEFLEQGEVIVYIMMVVASTGAVGNLLVCITIRRAKHLQTVTNYLLLNLASSDLLTCFIFLLANVLKLLGIPSEVKVTPFTHIFCHLFYSNYLFQSFSFVSVYNLVIISLERYVAIVHPLRYEQICSRQRVGVAVTAAWVGGFILYLIHLFGIYTDEGDAALCVYNHTWEWHFMPFVMGFLLPLAAMIWAYYQIITTLKVSGGLHSPPSHAIELISARRRVIRLMLLVTGIFVVLYGTTQPIHMIIVVVVRASYEKSDNSKTLACLLIYTFSDIPAMLTSVLNPIIYTFQYQAFRRGMREGLCPCLKSGKVSPTVSRVIVPNNNNNTDTSC